MVQMFVKERVSIVMPVYNGEQYLLPMLDSVLSQTYKEMEMILVDDGSTDGTVQAAELLPEGINTVSYARNINVRRRQ